jgi:hypothetical protein
VDNDLSPLADTEVHYLWSARAETEFKIFVGHCWTLPAAPAVSPAVLYYIDMVADMARKVGQLQGRRYPALNLRSETFPGEFHITVPPLVLSCGLRSIFGAPQ